MQRRYVTVDVFTDRTFGGNPLAVVLDADGLNAAQMQAIQFGDPGAPVSWRGADAGRYGTVVPGPAYQSNGTTCREYSHTIYIDRKPQSGRGTACRNPDGSWAPVS